MAVPYAAPVTMPLVDPTAALVLLLLQLPPAEASLSVVEDPMHTLDAPVITAGSGLTVTVTPVVQPVLSV
jgi:hypothetical protein